MIVETKLCRSFGSLDMRMLQKVYAESIQSQADMLSQNLCADERLRLAEQDFISYSKEFLGYAETAYAVLVKDGEYICALRLEKYRDGALVSGVETMPQHRQKGYATQLLLNVIRLLPDLNFHKLYSHVSKGNRASLSLHQRCGFVKIRDGATFLDGSASSGYVTLLFEI